MKIRVISSVVFVLLFFTSTVLGQEVPDSFESNKREKYLEFDDSLIEGMNNSPREFSTVTAKKVKKEKGHLYNEFLSFDREENETLRNQRYAQ